jgi:hypothetical protein
MKFMYATKPFGIGTFSLASESPYVNAKPNNSIWGQLVEIYLKSLQNFPYHIVQGGPKPPPKEALEHNNHLPLALELLLPPAKRINPSSFYPK